MSRSIIAFLLALHSAFPLATLQDVYKSAYQDYFGAEHMAPDSASVARYLDYELSQMDTTYIPDVELCGWRHRHQRISLAQVRHGDITRDEIVSAFLTAAQHPMDVDSAAWAKEWRKIERLAIRHVPEWRNDTLQADLRMCADSCYAVHHSPIYHSTYLPHYRIIRR